MEPTESNVPAEWKHFNFYPKRYVEFYKINQWITKPGFAVWRPDVMHAMFEKPACSNLFAAAADLDIKEQRKSQMLRYLGC